MCSLGGLLGRLSAVVPVRRPTSSSWRKLAQSPSWTRRAFAACSHQSQLCCSRWPARALANTREPNQPRLVKREIDLARVIAKQQLLQIVRPLHAPAAGLLGRTFDIPIGRVPGVAAVDGEDTMHPTPCAQLRWGTLRSARYRFSVQSWLWAGQNNQTMKPTRASTPAAMRTMTSGFTGSTLPGPSVKIERSSTARWADRTPCQLARTLLSRCKEAIHQVACTRTWLA